MSLQTRPIGLREANAFVNEVHRHHGGVRGHKFSIGAERDGVLCGVAIAGRPVARMLDDGQHIEVVRLATDGSRNVCSMLYSAVRRAAVAMGYRPHNVITYILDTEPGTSLRAAGWVPVAETDGGSWDRPSRARIDAAPTTPKVRWAAARVGESE